MKQAFMEDPQQIISLLRFVATGFRNEYYTLSDFGRRIQEYIHTKTGSETTERELLQTTSADLRAAADALEELLKNKEVLKHQGQGYR